MVNTAQDILTVNPERSGKSDSRLPIHPGWFHRCRHTGELKWVPASAVPDSAQVRPVVPRAGDRGLVPPAKRLANRDQEKATAQAGQQPQPPTPPAPVPTAPVPAAPPQIPIDSSLGGQLQHLATLKDQGVLSDDEFTAAKARLLGL